MTKKELKGQKIPFSQLQQIEHETLNRTNNAHWFVYVPEWNLTFKSEKTTDKILKVWKGKKFK